MIPPLPDVPPTLVTKQQYYRNILLSIHEWMEKAGFPGNPYPYDNLIAESKSINDWIISRIGIPGHYCNPMDIVIGFNRTVCKRISETLMVNKYMKIS